ncbi:zinc finger BED domain-containing protein 5 [Nephila pilipes]|uniref:Zinc finger BED domain-containing protein 5 n=1 Tax=Nephila pilipes TaxID=299642 RepID=A0A8X6PWV9_NEPPI|nr:zinc finger BED domain-containing protein 5 [Nephila pilipes]
MKPKFSATQADRNKGLFKPRFDNLTKKLENPSHSKHPSKWEDYRKQKDHQLNVDKFLRQKDSSSRTDDEEPSTSVTKNLKKVVKRKYDEDYIKYGFSWCGDETVPRSQCIICGDQLSNESMVPSKLKRYLYSSHPSCANKDKQYFKRCLEQNKKQKKFMKSAVTVSEKALEASYHVAKLIARQKKPHTVGETLIKPACMKIVRLMLGPNEVKEVNKVSLSADTVKRRIHDMSSDILGTLIKKLLSAEKFALQIDETTDIKNKAQLIAIVRFVDEDFIKEHYLFFKEAPERTTGEEIFRVTDDFFKICNIQWSNCIAVCTDGAAAITGRKKDRRSEAEITTNSESEPSKQNKQNTKNNNKKEKSTHDIFSAIGELRLLFAKFPNLLEVTYRMSQTNDDFEKLDIFYKGMCPSSSG